ncbi:MFS transporter [Marinithermofilum abyssi]|uniref:MFS transporter n=1 Tax=Marinithermofilum abyssi TaxID=1571185 RepID=A0A8J2YE45_9BACL|nr:MFS transporter [Marinithermofilum abyssi]GGE17746.1 MFS transporter [Marinithermofilum abyssi]
MKLPVSFRFMWLGQATFTLGDGFYIMASITWLYRETHSATFAAMVPFIRVGARMLSGLFAPLLMERIPLIRLLQFSHWAQAIWLAILTAVLLWAPTGMVFYPLLVILLFTSMVDGWMIPSRNAMVPRLVSDEELIRANGWLAATDQVVLLASWSLGGLIVAFGGIPCSLALTSLLYIAAALALSFVSSSVSFPTEEETKQPPRTQTTLGAGWILLWQDPRLRTITLMDIIEYLAGTVWIGAIILVFVKEILHQSEAWWGYLNASYYLGTILGGALVLFFSRVLEKRLYAAMACGSITTSLLTLVFASVPVPWLSLLLAVLMGPAYEIRDVSQRTLFQRMISKRNLPQVMAAHSTLLNATFGLSVFLIGATADAWGIRAVYFLAAGLLAISAGMGLTLIRQKNGSVQSMVGQDR